ncbi:MAG: tol-pal system protein YbgF [Acidobacteria bacterium]|nr:tol-pal system protein YbgF [Acidobacteriota bacterium]
MRRQGTTGSGRQPAGWWRTLPVAALPVLVLLTLACASSSTQLEELETGLAAVERRLDDLRSQTPTRDDLATVVQALEDQADRELTANANLKEDLRQIISELEALRTLVREQRELLNVSMERLEQTGTDVALIQGRLERQEEYLVALDELRADIRAASAPETVEPKTLYNAAYRDYSEGRYEGAISGFRRYLDTFPDGDDAGSAQYWLGESHLGQGQYRAAIEELRLVRERYPESDKVASSMLRIGVALNELGERDLAVEMFDRVRSTYPDTDEAILALQQLDNQGDEQ